MLCRVIKAAGLEVTAFGSAEEFLKANRTPDLACLILDMNLPGISGIELQQHLKESGYTIPTIFISGKAPEEAQQKVLKAGAVGFFRKPFSIDALLATVVSVISAAAT
jgi:FixJ family two-component response regulator